MTALLAHWKILVVAGLCAAVAGLFVLWRFETGEARTLRLQLEGAQAAGRLDQAQAAAAGGAAAVVAHSAARDARTLTLHTENAHAIEGSPGAGGALDPDLNAAGRRGLCGYAVFAADPGCLQLRRDDPRQRPQAGGGDGPAAP